MFNKHLFGNIFMDDSYNIRFGSYWDLAIQYSKRMWLFMPITIAILVMSLLNYIFLSRLKNNKKKVLLVLFIITIVLTIISTLSCYYGWYDYWAYESV